MTNCVTHPWEHPATGLPGQNKCPACHITLRVQVEASKKRAKEARIGKLKRGYAQRKQALAPGRVKVYPGVGVPMSQTTPFIDHLGRKCDPFKPYRQQKLGFCSFSGCLAGGCAAGNYCPEHRRVMREKSRVVKTCEWLDCIETFMVACKSGAPAKRRYCVDHAADAIDRSSRALNARVQQARKGSRDSG